MAMAEITVAPLGTGSPSVISTLRNVWVLQQTENKVPVDSYEDDYRRDLDKILML